MSAPLLPRLAIVNWAASADLGDLRSLLATEGFAAAELSGGTVHDRDTFLVEASRSMLGGVEAHNWSSFGDLLRPAVCELGTAVALVWTDAHRMLAGGLPDLVTALDLITGVARALYEQEHTLIVFLVGEGPNFPPLPRG